MAKRKVAKNPVPTTTVTPDTRTVDSPSSFEVPNFFPFARYTSIVGVNSSLMVFVGLFLPRSTTLFDISNDLASPPQTSRDRPQHPFLEPLTRSPVSTLTYICLGVIVLQVWWGGWVRYWWIDYSLRGTRDDKKMQKRDLERKKLGQFGSAWLFSLAASAVFHAALVILGAPLTSHIAQTYLLALILAVLTVFPPAYTIGLPSLSSSTESLLVRLTWTRLFAEFQIRSPIERAIVYPTVGTLLGSWLGAIPIALDWDRPWQSWPLTPTYGALIGYIISSMAALTVSGIEVLAHEHLHTLRDNQQN